MNHGCCAWDPQDKQDKNNRSGLLKEVMCHGLWARHQDMALEGLGKSVMVGCLKQQNVSFKVHFFCDLEMDVSGNSMKLQLFAASFF